MIAHVLSEEDRAELTRLEEAMWRPETRFDAGFQQKHFAPDFFEFGRSGRVHSRQQSVSVPPQEIRAVLPLANLVVRLLDRDTAQVTYDSQVEYGEATEHGRRSSIWSRTSSGWVMRFHQGTSFTPTGVHNVG
ncbi:MAG: DUF4440 domain-containing protein [Verrucomicrobiaceae bacterium]|nr:MAG: DUF4440 domain-containing protein [Verrucomicrobiaceae bacterium]